MKHLLWREKRRQEIRKRLHKAEADWLRNYLLPAMRRAKHDQRLPQVRESP